jgi:RNA polymerase sigma-70 factor (ECF subfamily)
MPVEKLENERDLEEAFNEWHEPLYRYTYLRLRNREATEDLVQEVFVKAWKYRESFDSEKSSLKNWLFVITTNTIRDFFRKNDKRQTVELSDDLASSEDLAGEMAVDDEVSTVFSQLKKLNEREQELILLRYREDLSVQDIAKALNLNYSATKVAIHRALKKLQTICNEET